MELASTKQALAIAAATEETAGDSGPVAKAPAEKRAGEDSWLAATTPAGQWAGKAGDDFCPAATTPAANDDDAAVELGGGQRCDEKTYVYYSSSV